MDEKESSESQSIKLQKINQTKLKKEKIL